MPPRPPTGVRYFRRSPPSTLRRANALEACDEEKGLAVAIHTRRLPDAEAAFERLSKPLADLAAANDLTVEPGRSVIEVRAPGTNKGDAVRTVAREQQAGGFLFAGADLGGVEEFENGRAWGRGRGGKDG